MCGIYMIKNILNNKIYIGQAKDISHRWSGHKTELNANRHPNRHLQGAWNMYGKDAFEFVVIEECDADKLDEKEQYYINIYNTYLNGYNMDKGGQGVSGFKHTEEQINKMRTAQNPLVVLQFDFEFNLVNRFEGGSSHAKKLFGYTPECIERCCKHTGNQIFYKNSYWVYEQEYQHENFSWDNYLNQISCCEVTKNKKDYTQKRICQYDKRRNLIKIWDSFGEIEKAGFIRQQVNTICNQRKNKKTHRGYIWTYEDYDWLDGYFDNLDDAYTDSIAKKRKNIRQIDSNGICVKMYGSLSEAANAMNVACSCITIAAKKHTMSCGYFWEYLEDDWFANNINYLQNYCQTTQSKAVNQVDECGNVVNTYNSRSSAGRAVGTSPGNISRAVQQHSLCCNYYWTEVSNKL